MRQTISTPLTYLNAEEIFWTDLTCRTKEHAWRSNQQSAILHNLIPSNRLMPKANLEELVDAISDSEENVDAVSKAKVYRD